MKSSAIAHANIALVKYWGKRNEELMLPYNSSISMTVSDFAAHTTVEFGEQYEEDIFILDGIQYEKGSRVYDKYIERFLEKVRKKVGSNLRARIKSQNNFPTGAGLASSAAGFAALATAINGSLSLGMNKKELSMLARLGSGSAARSVVGGFAEWKKGEKEDGVDSYVEQLVPPGHWPECRMIACVVSQEEKEVSSRSGMARTVSTSPFYVSWLGQIEQDLNDVRRGIKGKDIVLVGKTAQRNCLKMHALMLSTSPPLVYWGPATLRVIKKCLEWQKERDCFFTIDAGPQVKIICLERDSEEIAERCALIKGVEEVKVLEPGEGSRIVDDHLF
ncbi:MAG: diphosphomevalonate decarboxylase [Candidatus Nealsonbacteria bacterium]|nr:diphosphomevalonate decarboxylase [Candidatus Nealsonbacteria bacterium]